MPNDYNLGKFKLFLTGHNLDRLKNRSLVLALGPMGSGKSTTIGIQTGAVYKKNPTDKGYILVDAPVAIPATSDGYTSKTLHITACEDHKTELFYVDTAGLNENRGREEALWTRSSLDVLFSSVGEIRSILVVMNYSEVLSSRGKGFCDLAEELNHVMNGSTLFYNSMVFVITHAYEEGSKITKAQAIRDATRLLQETQAKETSFIAELAKRFPPPTTTQLFNTAANAIAGQSGGEAPPFNVNAVPEEDKQRLTSLQATQRLLKAFIAAENRIILSYPDGEAACRALRTEIVNAIRDPNTARISRDALRNLVSTNLPNNRLTLQSTLCALASEFSSAGLSQEASLLSQLAEKYRKKSQVLDAIECNWELVRYNLVAAKQAEIRQVRLKIAAKQAEITRIAHSTEIVTLDEIPVSKTCDLGFWGFRWLFNAAQANATCEYNGEAFLRHRIIGDTTHVEAKVTEEDRGQGRLKLAFESQNGYNIGLAVKIITYEKDAQATKRLVALREQEIRDLEAEIRQLEQSSSCLAATNSAEALSREVTRENENLLEQIRQIQARFRQLLDPELPVREWDAIKGLERMLLFLQNLGIIHPDLSAANRTAINEFLQQCALISNTVNDPYVSKLFAPVQEFEDVIIHPGELVPPTPPSILTNPINLVSAEQLAAAQNFFGKNQFTLGICMASWAVLLQCDFSKPLALTFAVGMYFALSSFIIRLEQACANVAAITESTRNDFNRELRRVMDEIQLEAQRALISANDLSVFAIRRLTERFEVNVDLRSNLRTLVDVNLARFGL